MRTVSVDPDCRAEHPRAVSAAAAPAGAAAPVGPAALQPSAYLVSALLAVVAAEASAAMWFLPDVLHGAPAMDGSARGTALVVLIVGVPLLVVSMWATSRGSARAMFVWAGTVAFLLYQAVRYVLATPFNALFLVYDAMLALAIWSAVTLVGQVGVRQLPVLVHERMPVRSLAAGIASGVVAGGMVIVVCSFSPWE